MRTASLLVVLLLVPTFVSSERVKDTLLANLEQAMNLSKVTDFDEAYRFCSDYFKSKKVIATIYRIANRWYSSHASYRDNSTATLFDKSSVDIAVDNRIRALDRKSVEAFLSYWISNKFGEYSGAQNDVSDFDAEGLHFEYFDSRKNGEFSCWVSESDPKISLFVGLQHLFENIEE